MPDIMITVSFVDSPTPEEGGGEVRFVAKAWHAQGQFCAFNAYAAFSATPNQMNVAIRDAAIQACALEGITVTANDKKTLFGGALNI